MSQSYRRRPSLLRGAAGAGLILLASAGIAWAQVDREKDEEAWREKPYTVIDGKVDFNTYNGYRRYHSHCHVCHGPDGLGSSYAPALVESIPRIGYERYIEVVMGGIENVNQTQQSVMPAFGDVDDVVNYIDDIYAYLKARADGAVGRGRPERLPK